MGCSGNSRHLYASSFLVLCFIVFCVVCEGKGLEFATRLRNRILRRRMFAELTRQRWLVVPHGRAVRCM